MLVRVLVTGLSTLAALALVQALGPQSYGLYAAGLSVASLAFVFGPLGVDQLQLFHGLTHRRALTLTKRVAACSLVVGAALAILWPGLEPTSRWCAGLLGVAAACRIMIVPWYITPHRRLQFTVRARREGVMLLAPVVLTTVTALVTADAIVSVAVAAGTTAVIASVAQLSREPDVSGSQEPALARGLPYAASAAVFTLYTTVGMAILSAKRPAVEVGQYKAAFMFLTAASLIPVVLNNDILRARLAAAMRDRERQFRLIRVSLVINIAAATILLVGLRYVGVAIAPVIYGPGFDQVTELLKVLALAVLPLTAASWAANALVGLGQVKLVLIVQSLAFAFNAAANVIVVGEHGATGVAWVTVATEGLVAGACIALLVRRRHHLPRTTTAKASP